MMAPLSAKIEIFVNKVVFPWAQKNKYNEFYLGEIFILFGKKIHFNFWIWDIGQESDR